MTFPFRERVVISACGFSCDISLCKTIQIVNEFGFLTMSFMLSLVYRILIPAPRFGETYLNIVVKRIH